MALLRSSGRTTELLRAAMRLSCENPKRRVSFVVWRACEVNYVMDMLQEESRYRPIYNLVVVPYSYVGRLDNNLQVYDHRVTEELDHERTGRRPTEYIKVALECNGWSRDETIPLEHWDRGYYRMAMCEPLSALAYSPETYTGDASDTVKIVDFRRTDRVNKDGLMIFEHIG